MFASANADSGEGSDWLPYYKLALGVLSYAFGVIEMTAEKAMSGSASNPMVSTDDFAKICEQRNHAKYLFKVHLRVCGIGPDESKERAAKVDEMIEDADL